MEHTPAKAWRALGADQIEAQFNPRQAVPDFEAHQARFAERSAAARGVLAGRLDLAYGAGPLHKVDVYPAAAGAPVHIFFHGGYWRAQDKANFGFVARPLVAAGVCTVIANYDLCPAVTLDGVVASAIQAIAWTWRHARDHGGDPGRLTLSGHSAGAHLAAMALAHDWAAEGLPRDTIKGAVPISGIYDPEPAIHTSVNAEIGLSAAVAKRNDALALAPQSRCPVRLFAGGAETAEWLRQTDLYADHLRRHGLAPAVTIIPGAHHFDIMDHFAEPDGAITRAAVELAFER